MITIEFAPVELLPDVKIEKKGPISELFLERGPVDFVSAAIYLRDLPYGVNESSADSRILFEDGYGTCNTKHGIFVRLAEEYNLPISRLEAFYPLTDTIVNGTNAILAEYGIPYIPRAHCFLKYGDLFFDLTEGNCNGKNGLITRYFELIDVPADQSSDVYYAMYDRFYEGLIERDPCFAALGMEKMKECYKRCSENNAALCPVV